MTFCVRTLAALPSGEWDHMACMHHAETYSTISAMLYDGLHRGLQKPLQPAAQVDNHDRRKAPKEEKGKMKTIQKLIFMTTVYMAGVEAVAASEFEQINGFDGLFFEAEGQGYRFIIGCEDPNLVMFRIETLALPAALQKPGAEVLLQFVDWDYPPKVLRSEVTFQEGGKEWDGVYGAFKFDATVSDALENAIGMRAVTSTGDIIFGDSFDSFSDVLFFMEDGCL